MRVPVDDATSARCICGQCPSYPDQDEPWLYCGRGKSKNEITPAGCLCPQCPIEKQYKLADTFYCMNGAAEW